MIWVAGTPLDGNNRKADRSFFVFFAASGILWVIRNRPYPFA